MKALLPITLLLAFNFAFVAAAPALGEEAAPTAAAAGTAATAEAASAEKAATAKEEGGTEDRVVVGEDLFIKEGDVVDGDAVVTGGDLTVNGTVTGDAVCTGGDLTVGPKAVISGDAVAIGGKIKVTPGAVISGERVCVGCGVPGIKSFKFIKKTGGEAGALSGRIVNAAAEFVFFGFLIFVALLLTVFLPRQFGRVEEHLAGDFPRSVLVGVAALLLLPLIMLVLAVTIVGIPLVALLILATLISLLVGYIVLARVLGRKLVGERPVMLQILVGLLLLHGAALLGDVIALPGGVLETVGGIFVGVGWVILIAGSFIGLGAVVYSWFGKRTLAETVAARAAKKNKTGDKPAPA